MSGDFSTAMLIPLLISGCGISLTAIVVLIYHLLIVHYCLGRQNQLAADANNLGFSSSAADPVPPSTKLGIDDSSLSLIPTAPYSGRMFDDVLKGDQSECAICLTDLEDGDPVRVLPNCRHVFHVDCIDHWLSSHVNCPFCRSKIFPFVFPEWIVEFRGGHDTEARRVGCLIPVCRRKDNPNDPKSNAVGETSHVDINVAENENENNNNSNENPPASSSSSTSFSSCFSPNGSANVPSEEDSISSRLERMSARLIKSLSQLRIAAWGTSSSSSTDSDSPC